MNHMNIVTHAIVSNSEMIKSYKTCREKAEGFGKVFILKSNQPDAVLFSIAEYKRLSSVIEYLETFNEIDVKKITDSLHKPRRRNIYSSDSMGNNLNSGETQDPSCD